MHASLPHADVVHDWKYVPPNRSDPPDPYKLKDNPHTVAWSGWWWYRNGDPLIDGTAVAIHRRLDGSGVFVGAREHDEEESFPPRFFPSLEAALVWIKLVAEFP